MDDQPTCGKGLAEHAPLVRQLGNYVGATAAVLEAHLPMLDITDPPSAIESTVYQKLVEECRMASELIVSAAERMSGSRDLAMGRHVLAPDSNAAMARVFAQFVESESAMIAALASRLNQDQEMLTAMREEISGRTPAV